MRLSVHIFYLIACLSFSAKGDYQCPDGSANEQETAQVIENLQKFQNISVVRRNKWLPECCQDGRRMTVGCTEKAQKFYDLENSIGNGVLNQEVKTKILDGDRVKPGVFWDQLCDPNRSSAGINPGVQRTYSNGMITLHDQEIPKDPKQYESEMKGMALLLDSPNVADPVTKDRMEMLSALYFDHVAKGWADIGYEFCVGRFSGTTFEARELGLTGAHVQQLNNSNIGVCLLGNTDQKFPAITYDSKFKLPVQQINNAEALIMGLGKQFQINLGKNVVTHNHVQDKDCCLNCNEWLKEITGNSKLTISDRLVSKGSGVYEGANLERRNYYQKIGDRKDHAVPCLAPNFESATNKNLNNKSSIR